MHAHKHVLSRGLFNGGDETTVVKKIGSGVITIRVVQRHIVPVVEAPPDMMR